MWLTRNYGNWGLIRHIVNFFIFFIETVFNSKSRISILNQKLIKDRKKERQKDKKSERQKVRKTKKTARQKDRKKERNKERKTDRQTDRMIHNGRMIQKKNPVVLRKLFFNFWSMLNLNPSHPPTTTTPCVHQCIKFRNR